MGLKDTRKSIKGKNVAEVGKKAGEMWKSLPADKKKTYGDRALEAKKKYSAYVATGKGSTNCKRRKPEGKKGRQKREGQSKGGCQKRKSEGFESKGKSQGGSQKGSEISQKGKGKSRKGCED